MGIPSRQLDSDRGAALAQRSAFAALLTPAPIRPLALGPEAPGEGAA